MLSARVVERDFGSHTFRRGARGPGCGTRFWYGQPQSERVFGINEDGTEQDEKRSLLAFLGFMKDFDCDTDELVGHNLLGFDLPFIFQRCLVHCISAKPLVDLREFRVRGVFDTMHHWWLGAKRFVSLDDVAWALGIESSKTATAEGSKVFELYHAGKLAEIREYNLNDVRVTRKVYERMVGCFGKIILYAEESPPSAERGQANLPTMS